MSVGRKTPPPPNDWRQTLGYRTSQVLGQRAKLGGLPWLDPPPERFDENFSEVAATVSGSVTLGTRSPNSYHQTFVYTILEVVVNGNSATAYQYVRRPLDLVDDPVPSVSFVLERYYTRHHHISGELLNESTTTQAFTLSLAQLREGDWIPDFAFGNPWHYDITDGAGSRTWTAADPAADEIAFGSFEATVSFSSPTNHAQLMAGLEAEVAALEAAVTTAPGPVEVGFWDNSHGGGLVRDASAILYRPVAALDQEWPCAFAQVACQWYTWLERDFEVEPGSGDFLVIAGCEPALVATGSGEELWGLAMVSRILNAEVLLSGDGFISLGVSFRAPGVV